MTDSLEPEDLQRIEDSLNPSKMKTLSELKKKLDETRKGRSIYPESLKKFLLERFSTSVVVKETRERISFISRNKGFDLNESDSITFGIRGEKQAYYVRDKKGKIRSWGYDTMKPDFDSAIRKKEQDIRQLEKKLEKEKLRLDELRKSKEKSGQ